MVVLRLVGVLLCCWGFINLKPDVSGVFILKKEPEQPSARCGEMAASQEYMDKALLRRSYRNV